MDRSVYVLALINLAFIGALPRIFFRAGRLNARWWATASPFFLAALLMILAAAGTLTPTVALPGGIATMLGATALFCCATSIALIGYTLGTHRAPLSLWHQDDEAPVALVTTGAYGRIRHPFYAAFIMALLGAAAALPHGFTAALLVLGAAQLDRTAKREERRLAAMPGGDIYRAYMRRTGRFVPPLRRGRRRPRRALESVG